MSEEKFNYEEFAKSMYEQSLALMPEDIGVEDKEYLATTIKQFVQVAGDAINTEYHNLDKNEKIICLQTISEWTFKKGIEITLNGINDENRSSLLQGVAFTLYEIIRNAIVNNIFNREYLDNVEIQVNASLSKNVMKLYCQNNITETVAKAFIKNDDEFNSLKNIVKKEILQEENWDFFEEDDKSDKYFNQQYEKFTNQILENPNNADAYYCRGFLQYGYGIDNNIVLSDFNKAIELNPNYVEAYQQRIYIYERLGEYEKIISEYEKIIEIEPVIENYDFYLRYLNTYIENGSKIALKVCEKIFELFPVSDKLYELRGSTYYNLKDYNNAISDYKKAVELCPKEDTWRMDYLKMALKQIEQEK